MVGGVVVVVVVRGRPPALRAAPPRVPVRVVPVAPPRRRHGLPAPARFVPMLHPPTLGVLLRVPRRLACRAGPARVLLRTVPPRTAAMPALSTAGLARGSVGRGPCVAPRRVLLLGRAGSRLALVGRCRLGLVLLLRAHALLVGRHHHGRPHLGQLLRLAGHRVGPKVLVPQGVNRRDALLGVQRQHLAEKVHCLRIGSGSGAQGDATLVAVPPTPLGPTSHTPPHTTTELWVHCISLFLRPSERVQNFADLGTHWKTPPNLHGRPASTLQNR